MTNYDTSTGTGTPNLWGREPALIIAAISAILSLAVGFGLDIDAEQVGLIMAAVVAVLGVATRSKVTPV